MKKTGSFNNQKREYLIENMFPRRPLKNFLWNEGIILSLDQFGFGLSKACIKKEFRSVVREFRLVYIRDDETGEFYDVNRNFGDKPFDLFQTRVGIGYHTVESKYKGLSSSFTILVPENDFVEMHRLVLTNERDVTKSFSAYTYINLWVNICICTKRLSNVAFVC